MPGTTLTVFRSRTADRNPRAMRGAVAVGTRLAARLGLPIQYCGEFEEPLGTDWKTELEAARPALQRLGRMLDSILSEDRVALTTLGRCASSIATLPSRSTPSTRAMRAVAKLRVILPIPGSRTTE